MITNNYPSLDQGIRKHSFVQQLLIPNDEETLYQAHFSRTFWSIEEFSALMGGISPERYKQILNQGEIIPTKLELKRITDTQKIRRKILAHLEEIYLVEKVYIIDGSFFMSSWKYIKWIAINDIPIKKRFFDHLPLHLMELYLEFQPENAPLRTKSKRSQEYHVALYLKNAKEVISATPQRLFYKQIYSHPYMENVLRQIRQLGGKCNKRTIITSWLPKLEKRKRGRPKKNLPQIC